MICFRLSGPPPALVFVSTHGKIRYDLQQPLLLLRHQVPQKRAGNDRGQQKERSGSRDASVKLAFPPTAVRSVDQRNKRLREVAVEAQKLIFDQQLRLRVHIHADAVVLRVHARRRVPALARDLLSLVKLLYAVADVLRRTELVDRDEIIIRRDCQHVANKVLFQLNVFADLNLL